MQVVRSALRFPRSLAVFVLPRREDRIGALWLSDTAA